MKVVETDNFGGDWPDEKLIAEGLTLDEANQRAKSLNIAQGPFAVRYFKVVPEHYQLAPGFEP